MSFSVNKVFLGGNVGSINTRQTNKGTTMVTFSIATQDGYGDKEITTWHNCIAFGKTADIASKYVSKGSKVLVEGKTTKSKGKDKNGTEREYVNVEVYSLQLLGSKGDITPDTTNNVAPVSAQQGDIPW